VSLTFNDVMIGMVVVGVYFTVEIGVVMVIWSWLRDGVTGRSA